MQMKRCLICGQEFPQTVEHFHRDLREKSHLSPLCINCHSAEQLGKSVVSALRARSQEHNVGFKFNRFDWAHALKHFGGKCAICEVPPQGRRLYADHWIPITKGGDTTPLNIVPLCKYCNSSKSNHPAASWLTKRYGEEKAAEILTRIEAYFASLKGGES